MSTKTNAASHSEGAAKVSVSFPPGLLEKIDREAAKDRRPRSQWIALQLEKLFDDHPNKDETDSR